MISECCDENCTKAGLSPEKFQDRLIMSATVGEIETGDSSSSVAFPRFTFVF